MSGKREGRMSLAFLPHGTHSRIDPYGTQDDWIDSNGDATPRGEMHPYDKRERLAVAPGALGAIRQTYRDAIAYRTVARDVSGIGLPTLVLMGLPIGGGLLVISVGAIPYLAQQSASVLKWTGLLAILPVLVYAGIAMIRLSVGDWFEPEDLPVVFDRRHRKVYRMLRESPAGLSAMFKRDRLLVCEYEWSLVEAVHRVQDDDESLHGPLSHTLTFLVRKSQQDPWVIDSFVLPSTSMDEAKVAPVWEHIRRFMEEDGPHLPHPDEALVPPLPPRSWWASLHEVGVFKPWFLAHWRDSPLLSLCSLVLLPVSLPLSLLWGTGHYLAARTAIPVRWPDVVAQRLGAPLPVEIGSDPQRASTAA